MGQIGPKQPIFKVETRDFGLLYIFENTHSTIAYIRILELTPVTKWVNVVPTAVPTASSINLPEGRTLNVNVKQGENDPAKKPPVEPKRGYYKIVNWEEGCPYCDSIPQSYDSYRPPWLGLIYYA